MTNAFFNPPIPAQDRDVPPLCIRCNVRGEAAFLDKTRQIWRCPISLCYLGPKGYRDITIKYRTTAREIPN